MEQAQRIAQEWELEKVILDDDETFQVESLYPLEN